MDYVSSKGLKLIYSVKDYYYGTSYCPATITRVEDEVTEILKKVNLFKNHPALLGWYINDELPILSYGDRMESNYNAIVQTDYNHPVFEVDYRLTDTPSHMRVSDIYGTDNYPVQGKEYYGLIYKYHRIDTS